MAIDPLLSSPFQIGSVKIPGRVILAPMDGYTDSPFRSICRGAGSAASHSEFINGIDVMNGHPHLKYKTFFEDLERPFVYQIFDDSPERLLETAKRLEYYKPDVIDINMGCSARNVSNRGAGAGLLKNPQKVGLIANLLVQNLGIPVTAKIRLGWDDATKNYLEIAQILQDNGISAITVHARTRRQEYSGEADWNAIGEIKKLASVPVIGNGDVRSLGDASRLINTTGCDAVMIGRAAIGNPWIFSGTRKNEISKADRYATICNHLERMTSLYPPRVSVMIFRKHLARYLHDWLNTSELRRRLFTIEDKNDLLYEIKNILTEEVKRDENELE